MSKALPIFGGIAMMSILYFCGATYWNLTSLTSLIHTPKSLYNLNLTRIPAVIETTITVSSTSAGKSKTFQISAADEQEFREKAALCVALCNERWGVTDCQWTF